MWKPEADFVVVTSNADRQRYRAGSGPVEQWLHRVGRHRDEGEFPVMLVRQLLRDNGYRVYVSGLSERVVFDSYSLAMFPGHRSNDPSFKNAKRVLGLDELTFDRFLKKVNARRAIHGLGTHGGDPDLLVQHARRRGEVFFVEVKAGSKTYTDKLTLQQELVFPLIRSQLRFRVLTATVHILR